MAPTEIALLQRAGRGMVVNISYIVESATFFGIFLALALTSIFTYIHHRTQQPRGFKLLSRASIRDLSWRLAVFALMTTLYASTIVSNVGIVKDRYINNAELELPDRFAIASYNAMKASLLSNWIAGQGGLIFLVGDGVVVWRAWVICRTPVVHPRARMFIFIPLFLLFATLAFSVASSAILTQLVGGTLVISNDSILGILTITAGACSLATNVSATAIIGFIAYHHFKEVLPGVSRPKYYSSRVLLYLLETGVIYCLLQAVYLTLVLLVQIPGSPLDMGAKFMQNMFIWASASYPFFILIIQTHQRTLADDVDLSLCGPNGTKLEVGTHISFSRGVPGNGRGRVGASGISSTASFEVTTYAGTPGAGVRGSMVQSHGALGELVPVQICETGKKGEEKA